LNEVLEKKLNGDSIEPVLKQLSWKGKTKIDGISETDSCLRVLQRALACQVTADEQRTRETRPIRERGVLPEQYFQLGDFRLILSGIFCESQPAWEDHSSAPTPPAAKRNPR
jgi:hypothetical protein